MKVAYVHESYSDWILTEICAIEKKGVEVLVCLADPKSERRVSVNHIVPHWTLCLYLKANFLAFCRLRARYLSLGLRLKNKIGLRLFLRSVFFARVCKESQIDHIHAHFATTATTMAHLISYLTGIPFSFTAHAYDIFTNAVNKEELRRKMLYAAFVRTVSQYHKRYLLDMCPGIPESKIVVISYGADVVKFRPQKTEKQAQFMMLSASNFVEKKGLPFLIEACKLLEKEGCDFLCYIVGNGPQRKMLEELVKKYALAGRVILQNFVPHGDLNSWYNRADVVVLPCIIAGDGDRDGIPNVLIEAMSAGRPVISTTVSGIPELIENDATGVMVTEKDPDRLSAAILRLYRDRGLADSMGSAARQMIIERFNIENVADAMIRMFEDFSGRKCVGKVYEHGNSAGLPY